MKKSIVRKRAEVVMKIFYTIGFILFIFAGSGFENATINNYIAILISFVLLGIGLFIEKF